MGGINKHLYQDWLQLFLLAVCLVVIEDAYLYFCAGDQVFDQFLA